MSDLREKIILELHTFADGLTDQNDQADQIISLCMDEAIEAVKNERNQTTGSRSHAIKAIEKLKQ